MTEWREVNLAIEESMYGPISNCANQGLDEWTQQYKAWAVERGMMLEPSKQLRYELTRDLVPGEPGYYGERLLKSGEIVYWYNGSTSGDRPLHTGMFVSEFGSHAYPYFEIPRDAVRVVTEDDEPGV